MPETEYWTEIVSDYLLERGERQIRGTRVFRRDDAGEDTAADSLPEVGDLMVEEDLTTTIPGCKCRGYTVKYAQGHSGTPERTYTYSTEETGYSSSGRSVPSDFLSETFEMSCSVDSFEPNPNEPDGDYWSWGSSNEVRQVLTRYVPHARLSIPFPQDMSVSLGPYLKQRLRDFLGRINSAGFSGFEAGQVMLVGATGGTYRDQEGELKVSAMLHFECRVLGADLKGSGGDSKDWLYVMSERTGKYEKPRTNTSSKYLYEEKSFGVDEGGLMAPVSEPEAP